MGLLLRTSCLDAYLEWRLIAYQREPFIVMLLENEAQELEDKQKVDGKHQGRLRTAEYTI